jgi:hypothetical protein
MVRTKWMILGALVLSLLFASVALAVGPHSIPWWVIGGGGGSTTVGSTTLDSTVGQWVVGSDESGDLQLGPGFWGGGWDETYRVFLPLILRAPS